MSGVRRTIAVVTGTRAELGLLAPVVHAIDAHAALTLRCIVTGTHLTRGTWRSVRDHWGLRIDKRVAMQRKGERGRAADVAALARGVAGLGKALVDLHADIVLVLGDRIEAFAAATAGSVGGVHVAHIHGGDRAEGVADEAMRHAITKLAHIHFPATAASRRRIVRMGERAEHVFNVGSPAIDEALLHQRNRRRDPRHLIVIQHPIGDDDDVERQRMRATLDAAGAFHKHRGLSEPVIVLDPNDDPGSGGIDAAISETLGKRGASSGRFRHVRYVPRGELLALLRQAVAIVGNSSAGLIDAAALRVPCVNVGPRQAGREKPANVIDCDYGREAVTAALEQARTLDLRRMRHPYGRGNAPQRIAEHLATLDLESLPLRKRNAY